MAVSDWSTTASSNTSIDGTNIAEGCPAGNANDGLRKIMANVRAMFASWAFGFLDGSTPLPVVNGGTGATSLTGLQVPTATVLALATSTLPSGYLKCNGAAVSRSTYATLFAAIGTTYGVGDGSTTFNLPELRGEFVRGWDDGRGVDAARAIGSAQAEAINSHVHPLPGKQPFGNGTYTGTTPVAAAGSGFTTGSTTSANTGAGSETRPRNVALMYCIKY